MSRSRSTLRRPRTPIGRIASAAAVAIASSAAICSASEISVHFYNTNTAIGSGQTAGAPGAQSNGTWNNWSSSNSSGSLGTVVDSSGVTLSSVSVTYANVDIVNNVASSSSSAANWTSPSAGDLDLYAGSLVIETSHATGMSVTVNNIPYSTYNLYVYFQGAQVNSGSPFLWNIHDSGTGLTDYWLGDQSGGKQQTLKTYVQATDYNDPSGTNAVAANYAIFAETGGPGTSDTITLPDATTNGAGIYGIQIVATPEPGSLTCALAGAAALMLRRRRKPRSS